MKVRVYVTLKNGVLDPQGKAVEHSLQSLGFPEAKDLRMGRLIEFTFTGARADAQARVALMCQKLLANTVIEQYTIECKEVEN